ATYLAKQLETKVTFHKGVTISSIAQTADGWQAQDNKSEAYRAKALLMSPPAPQSLSLLGDIYGQLTLQDHEALERIAYIPCLAGLFQVEGEVNLPEPGALQRPDADLSWIADNQRKGISPHTQIITVHASGTVSQKLW